jgi:hypothetical protein
MAQFIDRVSNNLDDGYWAGSWSNSSGSGGIGKNFLGGDVYSGWRWRNVTVPNAATITSAFLRIIAEETKSDNIFFKVFGIAEDNTSDFSSDPGGRTKTTANTASNINGQTLNTEYTIDVTSVIQEIVNRGGWASGNALGLITQDNGTSNDKIGRFWSRDGDSTKAAQLEINYGSTSTVMDLDLKYTVRTEQIIEKMLRYVVTDMEVDPQPFTGIKVAKAGHNAVNTNVPEKFNFHSDFGTLKYFDAGSILLNVNHGVLTIYNDQTHVDHNLGYFPLVMVYCKDDLMSNPQPLGRFQAGSGAFRQFYYYITNSRIYFVANGYTGSLAGQNYDVTFYYKIFKNDLNL